MEQVRRRQLEGLADARGAQSPVDVERTSLDLPCDPEAGAYTVADGNPVH